MGVDQGLTVLNKMKKKKQNVSNDAPSTSMACAVSRERPMTSKKGVGQKKPLQGQTGAGENLDVVSTQEDESKNVVDGN